MKRRGQNRKLSRIKRRRQTGIPDVYIFLPGEAASARPPAPPNSSIGPPTPPAPISRAPARSAESPTTPAPGCVPSVAPPPPPASTPSAPPPRPPEPGRGNPPPSGNSPRVFWRPGVALPAASSRGPVARPRDAPPRSRSGGVVGLEVSLWNLCNIFSRRSEQEAGKGWY